MDRREFLKRSLALGIGAGFSMIPGAFNIAFGEENGKKIYPDLVAVQNGDASEMFEAGIKALGGMESYVSKGDTVVIKPNIGWAVKPEYAANTNPYLVGKVVEHCYKAGAKQVYVFDYSCDDHDAAYKMSEIANEVKKAGGKAVKVRGKKDFINVRIPKAKTLKKASYHKLIVESDVFINIPVLKDHMATSITISMKNLMGAVWERKKFHRLGLHQCIADSCSYRKPDLNIVDASRIMVKYGPRGINSPSQVLEAKKLLISSDIVAVDSAASRVFGYKPEEIKHIKIADEMKLGTMDLRKLKIKKISV